MSAPLTFVLLLAMFGLVVTGARDARRGGQWRTLLFDIAALGTFGVFLNRLFGFPVPTSGAGVAKGQTEEITIVIVLFASMLLGMLAQLLYRHFRLPLSRRVKRRLDWGALLPPVCASPIVFIPLLVALQTANIDLYALTAPRMMIFFVAFQNGFFWKEHFDLKRQVIGADGL